MAKKNLWGNLRAATPETHGSLSRRARAEWFLCRCPNSFSISLSISPCHSFFLNQSISHSLSLSARAVYESSPSLCVPACLSSYPSLRLRDPFTERVHPKLNASYAVECHQTHNPTSPNFFSSFAQALKHPTTHVFLRERVNMFQNTQTRRAVSKPIALFRPNECTVQVLKVFKSLQNKDLGSGNN